MLTILSDPAGATGRQRYPWDYSRSMQDNIAAHLACGGDCELLINGQKVDPLTDPRLDAPPSVVDNVMVVRRPAGFDPVTWAYIAIAALAVYTYTQIPKLPPDALAKQSPNNSLTGQTNIARTYQAIPDVYGYRRCWPDLIQPSLVEYVDNVKLVTEWLCVSRGKGDATDIRYADTPIGDIDGASYTLFEPASSPDAYPENNDTTLTDVVESFELPGINWQELTFSVLDTAVAIPGTSTITNVGNDGGGDFFEMEFTDGAELVDVKALAPGGEIYLYLSLAGTVNWQRGCTVDSYVESSPNVTIKFYFGGDFPGILGYDVSYLVHEAGGSSADTLGPYTMPVDNADQLRWNVVFQRGLVGEVIVRSEWWQIDGGGTEVGGSREFEDVVYSANSYSQQAVTHTVTPAAGAGLYRLQLTRISASLENGADVAQLEGVFALRNYATKVLPGVTVIKVTARATSRASGFTERKFNLRFARHVRTLSSTTLSASRNFARIMAHVWALAGQDIAELDTTTLAAINTDLGETADVLRFDGTFDDADMSLGERMQRIAWHARCTLWWDGGQWTVTRDQLRAEPELQLDYRNLAASGESIINYASHLPLSWDGVEIEYVDEDTQAKKAYVRIDISSGTPTPGLSRNPQKIKMPCCATLTQATNRADLEARRLLYQRTSVTDTTLADAGSIGPGSLVRWIDPNDFAGDDGLQAGEVMAIDVPGLKITTSEALDWKSEVTGRILLTGVDGKHLGAPIVCTPVAGQPKQAALASIPAGLYVRGGDAQLGSRYAFAVGLTEAEVEAAGLYVVTELRPGSDRTTSIALANYDERMYSED